jgi:hypothetical protein
MTVTGSFRLERPAVRLGEPIALVLRVCNPSDRDAFVYVPHGRADGVRIRVLSGAGLRPASLEREPEPGLVGELRLAPGDCHEAAFPLHEWIDVDAAGAYTLECALDLETTEQAVQIVSRIDLVIEP